VWELGKSVFNILDHSAPDDLIAPLVIRLPERGLVDPICLFQNTTTESEGLKNFDCPTRDAVSLTDE